MDDSDPKVEGVGEMCLDDAIADDWYDSWKELEGVISFDRNYPGYYETEIHEQLL